MESEALVHSQQEKQFKAVESAFACHASEAGYKRCR